MGGHNCEQAVRWWGERQGGMGNAGELQEAGGNTYQGL